MLRSISLIDTKYRFIPLPRASFRDIIITGLEIKRSTVRESNKIASKTTEFDHSKTVRKQ